MSEEERQKIAGKVLFELSDKKKGLACLKAKAHQVVANMNASLSLLTRAIEGKYPSRGGIVIRREDDPEIGSDVNDLVDSIAKTDREIQSLKGQLREMGLQDADGG